VLEGASGTRVTEAMAMLEAARTNRLKVMEGAFSVEVQLEAVILHYFLGTAHGKRAVFESLILKSDWCSFSAKRKLVKHIIGEQGLLEGPEKNHFDDLVRKVISFRNAFTHGKLASDATRVWMSFFEGIPHKVELTDDYLAGVEDVLRAAYRMASDLVLKSGASHV
jgi:hypothetical protein